MICPSEQHLGVIYMCLLFALVVVHCGRRYDEAELCRKYVAAELRSKYVEAELCSKYVEAELCSKYVEVGGSLSMVVCCCLGCLRATVVSLLALCASTYFEVVCV